MRRFTLISAVLLLAACSSDDTTAVPDAGQDSATKDATVDAPKDAPADVAKDAPTEASTDAGIVDASDASLVDASDASLVDASDAGDASTVDASDAGAKDATADAADAGGSIWRTPTCDGTINAGEYGTKNSFTTGGGQVWSMTWNATNLYLAVTNAAVGEAVVVYTGFGGNTGLTAGQNYDGTAPGTLKFKADAVLYAKSTYNEVRKVSGNAWGAPTAAAATFCGTGSTRELVIPWTALGANSIPASFRYVAYATSSGGFVYGQIPTTNPGGSIGTGMNFPNDYFVASTNDGAGSFPFDTVE